MWPWVGFISSVYFILISLVSRNVLSATFICSVTFLVSTIIIASLHNSDRYLLPVFLFAIPSVAYFVESLSKQFPARISMILPFFIIVFHIALAGQSGFGGGPVQFKAVLMDRLGFQTISNIEHISNWRNDRHAIDSVIKSHQYGRDNVMVLGKRGGITGNVIRDSWYNNDKAIEFRKKTQELGGLKQFIKANGIDVFVVHASKLRRYIIGEKWADLSQELVQLSDRITTFGGYTLFHIGSSLSFKKIEPVKFDKSKKGVRATYVFKGFESVWVEGTLDCEGVGSVVVFGGGRKPLPVVSRHMACLGKNTPFHVPLQTLGPNDKFSVTFHGVDISSHELKFYQR